MCRICAVRLLCRGVPLSHPRDGGVSDVPVYGLFQAMLLTPGVSRSGAATSSSLLLRCAREAVVRHSLFLAIAKKEPSAPIFPGAGAGRTRGHLIPH
ncbi:undecaprenyl-diphosphate phosphatase [Streptomyces sp. NPDC057939]|uniref:undecaprenyl-diphosphate phosphatase n=1 Tax=Streptomyces sp. NPDC057939 TaxID=3346284 RepID=UPI0036E35A8D